MTSEAIQRKARRFEPHLDNIPEEIHGTRPHPGSFERECICKALARCRLELNH